MKKTALLIGNDSYRDPRLAPLVVPCEDVRALSEVLADPAIGGFDAVKPLLNCDRAAAAREVERLFREAGRDDLVLLYFSGHGVLDRYGRLWLALAETDLDSPLASALRSDDLRDLMEQGTCRRQVLILDCCYSGAFARPAKDSGDAQAVTPQTFEGEGRVALLSSTATQRSYEGNQVDEAIERSLFTHHLVEGLRTGAAAPREERITEEALFLYAHDRVRAAGAGMTPQRWVGRQHGRLVLARNPAWRADPRAPLPADLLEDLESPRVHVREGAVLALARLLTGRAPEQAAAARAVLESRLELERDRFVYQEMQAALGQEGAVPLLEPRVGKDLIQSIYLGQEGAVPLLEPVPPSPVAPAPRKPSTGPRPADPEPFSVFRDSLKGGGEGPEMVRLPAGEFLMGSAEGSPGADSDERPQHRVRIPDPIAIGRFPVTFDEYDRFCADTKGKPPNDHGWGRGRRPAIHVSWHDAVAYCVWLSAQTGQTYRLPSEAEWEYACRAGSLTAWSFGGDKSALGEHAWFMDNSNGGTHPVGEKRSNRWGLHDMQGNVWEWVQDCWHDSYDSAPDDGVPWQEAKGRDCALRVVRGGGWSDFPEWLRSAFRDGLNADVADDFLGFRLARTL